MAKKVTKKSGGELPDPLKSFLSVDEGAEIIANSNATTEEWISTGSYILDAAISGSMGFAAPHAGIPSNRIVLLAGESQTGKSYLSCNIARECQKKGYNILYIDSEGSISANFVERLGCDPNKMVIRPCETIQQATHVLLQLIDMCEKEEEKYGTHNKWAAFVDSVGNLSSFKEREDNLKIDPANGTPRDMSKAQATKQLFRCITAPCSRLQIPVVVVSHTYDSMSMYSSKVISGGSALEYSASVIIELSRAKIDDKETIKRGESTVNSSDIVRYGSNVTAKIRKSRFTIPHKISMYISFFSPMPKSFGCQKYLNWENSLVGRGTLLTEKEVEKLTPAERANVKTFEYNGELKYALLKDTARSMVIGRKNIQVPLNEFFTEKVFDKEFLTYIDEHIIRPEFELPSVNKLQELESMDMNNMVEDTDENSDE